MSKNKRVCKGFSYLKYLFIIIFIIIIIIFTNSASGAKGWEDNATKVYEVVFYGIKRGLEED